MTSGAIAKLVKDTIAVRLLHLGVNVVTRVAKFRNFLCEQLDAVDRIAKDDTLVDFEFRKESVQAMHLLTFLDVGIELGDTS